MRAIWHEARGAVEPDGLVPQGLEVRQIAAGAASEVEDREGRGTLDGAEQRVVVLRHVVVAGPLPERPRRGVVVGQRT